MRHSDLVEWCFVALVLLAIVLLTWSNWSECRGAGFSILYCLTHA